MSFPTDIDVVDIDIVDFGGSKREKITRIVRSINIVESMDNHTLTASIIIDDGYDLMGKFPIRGEEEIIVNLQTNPDSKPLEYKFFVDSVLNVQINTYGTMKTYTLKCVTKDYLKNACTLYSKRYTGLGYKDAVESCLLNDLGTTKPFVVEQTVGSFDYMVNRKRPLQTLSILTERAVSLKNQSHVFFFFENHDGYHFTTLENLVNRNRGRSKVFRYTTNENDDIRNHRDDKIYEYSINQIGDGIDKIRSGGLRQVVREFDILYGDYWRAWEYNNPTDYAIYKSMESKYDMNSQKFQRFVTKNAAVRSFVVTDTSKNPQSHNDTLAYTTPYKRKLSQLGVSVRVPGDTGLTAGDVVTLNLPEVKGDTAEKGEMKYFSQKYIVVKLKHKVEKEDSGGFSHYCIMDCRKTTTTGDN